MTPIAAEHGHSAHFAQAGPEHSSRQRAARTRIRSSLSRSASSPKRARCACQSHARGSFAASGRRDESGSQDVERSTATAPRGCAVHTGAAYRCACACIPGKPGRPPAVSSAVINLPWNGEAEERSGEAATARRLLACGPSPPLSRRSKFLGAMTRAVPLRFGGQLETFSATHLEG